ncbi:MAG: stage II sporulation protein R [Clostridia bacterium]
MKKFALSVLIGTLITSCIVCYSQGLSEELSQDIVRLHVIAQSDSKEDQKVKLMVRDSVLKEVGKIEKKEDIEKNLPLIEECANKVLCDNGFDYKAKVQFGVFTFPTKYYDGFALPKGEYEAVRVILGEGKGENWWCVLFPPLCMVDAATDEQTDLLKETFGKNYAVVTDEKPQFNIKFKLAEMFS